MTARDRPRDRRALRNELVTPAEDRNLHVPVNTLAEDLGGDLNGLARLSSGSRTLSASVSMPRTRAEASPSPTVFRAEAYAFSTSLRRSGVKFPKRPESSLIGFTVRLYAGRCGYAAGDPESAGRWGPGSAYGPDRAMGLVETPELLTSRLPDEAEPRERASRQDAGPSLAHLEVRLGDQPPPVS